MYHWPNSISLHFWSISVWECPNNVLFVGTYVPSTCLNLQVQVRTFVSLLRYLALLARGWNCEPSLSLFRDGAGFNVECTEDIIILSNVWIQFPLKLESNPQEMVKNAVNEMRRYYSRKVIDVLVRVTRRTLDLIIKQFAQDEDNTDGNFWLLFSSVVLS